MQQAVSIFFQKRELSDQKLDNQIFMSFWMI